jgi:hypothetical protein
MDGLKPKSIMAKTIHIPKTDKDHTIFPAWIPTVDSSGKSLKPSIRCKCGVHTGIGLHHVHPDGRITASYFHELKEDQPEGHKGCGWHVYLILDGWTGEEYLPNK